MFPTLHFRQVEITWSVACGPDNTAFFHRNGRRNKGDKITGYKLQQWWTENGTGPNTGKEFGEWRDVEIVEE